MTVTTDPESRFAALAAMLSERSTCRQFLSDPVAREVIEQLLQLAQRTPSWCNTQPWHVIVTEGPGTERFRQELLAHVSGAVPEPDFAFPAQYSGVRQDRRRDCGQQLYESVGVARGDHAGKLRQAMRNFEFFDAPHVAVLTTAAELGTYGAVDCGLYISTFLLAAHSLGLATAPQAALAAYSPFLHDHFDIPDDRKVVVGIPFGYADTDHPVNAFRTSRADLADVVTWHTC
ncbi:MAG: nitroreductase [Nocardiaceae bacterium]|nr:nitroreductase [Nocardiaceae bacterium]